MRGGGMWPELPTKQAEEIISSGKGDIVLIAKEFLRDAFFAQKAAQVLGLPKPVPKNYEWAIGKNEVLWNEFRIML